ncbi:MAG: GNAT family N-acetyltransferase [Flavobacteriia bacterium]|nr:GNAT family N-acetyltransferase [Flavobacteriia bacterium]
MEFSKVFAEDENRIIDFFRKHEINSEVAEGKRILFQQHWKSPVNYYGVMVTDQDVIIAFLGLIFSVREINLTSIIFSNLTSLMIDPNYRGQKLTDKIIQYVQTLGDYTLTAITPIPSLYNMYKRNGFIQLNDNRKLFWKNNSLLKDDSFVFEIDLKKIEKQVEGNNKVIFDTHKGLNCDFIYFKNDEKSILIIMKRMIVQKRKIQLSRTLNYLDFGLRKLTGLSFLNKAMEIYEIHFVSDYVFLCENFEAFSYCFFDNFSVKTFDLRIENVSLQNLKYKGKITEFYHSRQLFFSTKIKLKDYDVLFSEIFLF